MAFMASIDGINMVLIDYIPGGMINEKYCGATH